MSSMIPYDNIEPLPRMMEYKICVSGKLRRYPFQPIREYLEEDHSERPPRTKIKTDIQLAVTRWSPDNHRDAEEDTPGLYTTRGNLVQTKVIDLLSLDRSTDNERSN